MAGATFGHILITGNLVAQLKQLLRDRDCTVHPGDLRVRVSATGLYTYPEIVIACGQPQFVDDEFDTLLNPKVLIEVLSDSTEAYDRGAKAVMYRQLPSLQEYVLVAQNEPLVECQTRQTDGNWLLKSVSSLNDQLVLNSLSLRIPVSEVYRQVEFPPAHLRAPYPQRALPRLSDSES